MKVGDGFDSNGNSKVGTGKWHSCTFLGGSANARPSICLTNKGFGGTAQCSPGYWCSKGTNILIKEYTD